MIAAIFCCAAMLAAGAAGTEQDTATRPAFRATTRIVEVTVLATGKKNSIVENLRASDIQVLDNKQQQTIRSWERVETLTHAAGAPRFSIILLDALNTHWSDREQARKAAVDALREIAPEDRVAVFALGGQLLLLHDFTSDFNSLQQLIRRFWEEPLPRAFDTVDFGKVNTRPSKYDANAEGSWIPDSTDDLRKRIRVVATLGALTAIARRVQRIPGQKNLLWLSAAFELYIPVNGGVESLYDEAANTARELSSANVTLYPIDARGVSISKQAAINIDNMKRLAEDTGGKAYYNSNDLAGLVRSAMDDSRNAYVLTYSPSDYQEDGKFHQIRLKTSRKDVHLRCRPGYFAERPPATAGH